MFPNLSFPPKEWLLTNGLGGYAMGCVDEVNRRKYHGYLIGAVNSPSKRINYLNELIFSVELDGKQLRLGGLENDALEILFKNEGQVVHWTYVFEDFQIRKTIWMRYGFNETHVRLEFSGQLNKIRLYATPLFSIRDHHATVMADTKDYMVLLGEQDVWVAHEDVGATRVDFGEGNFMRRNQIVTEPIYVIESMRGECDEERCFSPGEIWMDLDAQNSTWEFVITDGNVVFSEAFDTSLNERRAMQKALLEKANAESGPKWLQQAVIGADKFVVQRGDGLTIVAGYPWFTDWGRDTMISLPGLLLANGRNEDALQILNSFKNILVRECCLICSLTHFLIILRLTIILWMRLYGSSMRLMLWRRQGIRAMLWRNFSERCVIFLSGILRGLDMELLWMKKTDCCVQGMRVLN